MALWIFVLFLGFMIHFLLVLGTDRLCGCPANIKGALQAGILGGVYASACILPGFAFLGQIHWRLVFLLLSAWFGFRRGGALLLRGGLYLLLHLSVGQIATGEIWCFILAAGAICLLCSLGIPVVRSQGEYADVTITHQGKRIHLTALRDTGNTLRDPVSGDAVLVVDRDVATELLDMTHAQLQDPMKTMVSHVTPGLRLIPYHGVGQPSGLLLGLRAEQVMIDGCEKDLILAFAPDRIGRGEAFRALAGGII